MVLTKYAVATAALMLATAGTAMANPTTDAITREWNYVAPNDPNAIPLRSVDASNSTCPAGTVPMTRDGTVFCNGQPINRFVTADQVPAGYTGRVFVINPYKSGYQTLQ
ncbi:MAG: hypothetical protein VX202_09125 [Pseudomonadota bacterium]|jgi:hypothetical protein|uniref:hypothetical protein n=1 Tax=Rhodovulum sp. FJ3 TaxID=3079053 RepID=UPI00293DC781|nr:hypothetical protein [Rhodovulum sp. FJ3]MDV4166977.1 hypothetical protein [Rhodovulum sp. FJ3]MEE3317917.1 hypothetical protein [Pseudomonadota bacterium]